MRTVNHSPKIGTVITRLKFPWLPFTLSAVFTATMKLSYLLLAFRAASLLLACPVEGTQSALFNGPRLVIYFQMTHHADGNPIPILPLITPSRTALTHLIIRRIGTPKWQQPQWI